MTAVESRPAPIFRLPWALILATLIAAAALWVREGRISSTLPVLALLLLFSAFSGYRLENETVAKILRFVLFGGVLLLSWKFAASENSSDLSTVFEARYLDACAEVCMAEIVIRAWTGYSSGYRHGVVTILLSGVVFLAASNTSEPWVRYFTPPYMLFLALALQSFYAPPARRTWRGRVIALSLAILLGAGTFYEMMTNKTALNQWGMQFLEGMHIPLQEAGLNDSPQLGSLWGREGSLDRVLRIRTQADISHLRVMSFDSYRIGGWGPTGHERTTEPVLDSQLNPDAAGVPATATRLMNLRGFLLMPLNTVGLDTQDDGPLRWDKTEGGPIRTSALAPTTYIMRIGNEDAQGLFCEPPDARMRRRLLDVPNAVDPRVKTLARTIVGNLTDPLQKAHAIEAYLPAHHPYSLYLDIGRGDPISNFLLTDGKAAHCEFFGSGAVMLMRCVGIPARYVIGYYAHENEDDSIIVRQRDAHAWAECWIDGKGWMTIDATPSDGRPDQRAQPLPSWRRFIEWLQDGLATLREKITGISLVWVAGLLLVPACGLYLLQGKFKLRWKRAEKARVLSYTLASADLKRLFAGFETFCRRRGVVCPPGTPWQEYLTQLQETLPAASAFPLTEAHAFVTAYNAVRFGNSQDPAAYKALKELLTRLERSTASVKETHRS